MRSSICRAALTALGICVMLAPATAQATSSEEQILTAKSKGVAYLEGLQKKSGGFESDWDIDAAAASGVAAANLKITGAETDARSWYQKLLSNELASKWPEKAIVTEYERGTLVGYAAGIDPARFSKAQNLLAEIASFYQPATPGYYGPPENFNGTVFGLLALENAKSTTGVQRVPQVLLKKSIEVIERNQHTDGGWGWEKAEGNEAKLKAAAEPDMTGAAMAALCGAKVANTESVIKNGEAYLKSVMVAATGGFEFELGENTDSNAWAIQGLNACKIEAQGTEFTAPLTKKTPIDFLISEQLSSPSGAFKYQPSKTSANEYSSQDAVRALAGAGFTAAPPVPTGSPKPAQWSAASGFSKTVKSPLTLVINNESEALKVCSVAVSSTASEAETVPLEKVLLAAEGSSSPTGCVTGHASEGGAISQINGFPSEAKALWDYSIDGGSEKQATLSTAIHLGDTIYLRFS